MPGQSGAPRMNLARTFFHFLKWTVVLLPVYLIGGIAAGALGFIGFEQAAGTNPDPAYGIGLGYTTGDGAGLGAMFALTSGLPVFIGLWMINSLGAWFLLRTRANEPWARWVFWGFGLAAGMMPVLAFVTSGLTFVSTRSNADLAALDAERQARVLALAQAGQTATIILTLALFVLALFVSWWNLRAGKAWAKKTSAE